MQNPQLC